MIQLGFLETVSSHELQPKSIIEIPNKVGGFPIFLDPKISLNAQDIECPQCSHPMVFLLQIYTPEDFPLEAFHRLIHVFCCKNGKCHKQSKKCFKFFRSQLPQDNSVDFNFKASKCVICGLQSSKVCSQCKTINYCCRSHQQLDWNTHKSQCTPGCIPNSFKLTFPEYELVSELEPMHDEFYDSDLSSQHLGQMLESTGLENMTEEDCDLIHEEETEVGVDKAFLKFQKKMAIEPDQVMRYLRVEGSNNPIPLWISDIEKPEIKDIPACEFCGNERTCEFQITSQILNHLDINHLEMDSLDFGTLIFYSCSASCQPKDVSFMPEIVWRQDFTQQGINHRLKSDEQTNN